ncbi:mitochondrial inner membrane protease subunit 1 [Bactrocera neohumeralis]|uniref:mitochondrial inner membrane protease subunit 1 n=1 Tax=Bactrocera tryoni TaxID=59916 RepID=UPI001A989AAF|nr:mitochondrial inner membrane protease subunit 1 [Bactrocera tryoni]XP_050331519.1 mitochondrial inner membrane protease subunit 1 [Bactrocera neohumeralis]
MVSILSRVKDVIKYSMMYACLTHCTFEYVGDFVVCNGPSMEPTLHSKNILLTERISTRFHNPRRGDIIIAVSPTDPKQFICKRIVGIPGDRIVLKNNTKPIDTDIDVLVTSKKQKVNEFQDEYVPRGYIWIEGDNSENSSDSRYYGPIPLGLVKSRVVCRLWPIKEARML